MAKLFTLLGALTIAGYLCMGRVHWFSEWEDQASIGKHPIFSAVVDVATPNTFRWHIPKEDWFYQEGEAEVSLVLEPGEGLREDSPFEVRFASSAITTDERRIDRTIQDRYYDTDRPIAGGEPQLWTSGSEFGLGATMLRGGEELYVELTVLVPDPALASVRPRMKIVGEHDYAIYGHLWLPRAIRDGGLGLCLTILVALVLLQWRTSRKLADTRASAAD